MDRGLRRTSYQGSRHSFSEPEYVNIFDIPFTLLTIEGDTDRTCVI